jgi:hypothetical protein
MASRLLLLSLAVVGVAVAAHALRADHRCAQAKADALKGPTTRLVAVARATADRCGAPGDRAVVLVALLGRGRSDLAVEVAREMTETSQDDYNGWLALWQLARDRRALARAHALDPRDTPAR